MISYNIIKQTNKKFYCKKCGNTLFKNLKIESSNNILMVLIDCSKCNFNNMIYHNKVKKVINLEEEINGR